MSQITWLHLSDIHFHPKSEWSACETRSKLLAFLTKRFEKNPQLKPDFICCTGDIAFGELPNSPLSDQYTLAKVFFDKLLAVCGVNKERLFVVPGNHDINRRQIDAMAQSMYMQWAGDSHQHIDTINQDFAELGLSTQNALKRLAEYNQFVADYLPHQQAEDARCVYNHSFVFNDTTINILGLNSAWNCSGKETDGDLWLGSQWQFNQRFSQRLNQGAGQDNHKRAINIALMHHPLVSIVEAERNIATNRIEADFDFFLHGHSHNTWVSPGNKAITVSAGALGAGSDPEFGFNITRLDLVKGSFDSHLYTYSKVQNGWKIYSDANHAEDGIWQLKLKDELIVKAPQPEAPAPALIEQPQNTNSNLANREHYQQKVYGREKLLVEGQKLLNDKPDILIYGMRGNGKSMFIGELLKQAPLAGKALIRLQVGSATNVAVLYQHLASALGDKRENVIPPSGDINTFKGQIAEYQRDDEPYVVWLENAHLLFNDDTFIEKQINYLVQAIRAVRPNWQWIFELREKPQPGLVPKTNILEVPGLDMKTLGQLLQDATPEGLEPWKYNRHDLKGIYQWLGGGHQKQAHPLAIQLLVEIAKATNTSPKQVKLRHVENFDGQLEEVLLNDLYNNVLNKNEQDFFATMALYRQAIPELHIHRLEQKLNLAKAFTGIDKRCLVTSNADESQYYLHGFFSDWLRTLQGYQQQGEDYDNLQQSLDDYWLKQKHKAVFESWQEDVKGKDRINKQNIIRTNEALFHLIQAGDYHLMADITASMLGADSETVFKRLFALCNHLHKIKAPYSELRALLAFLIAIKPREAILYRFLGSAWRLDKGWQHAEVLANFKRAVELESDRAEQWANYGKACLATKNTETIERFLAELSSYEQTGSGAGINGFVLAVRADCYQLIGEHDIAFEIRQKLIMDNIRDPVIYADQARTLMADGKHQLALEVLAKAQENGVFNEHCANIKANILTAMGDQDKAIQERQALIDEGTQNVTFYSDQANAYINRKEYSAALEVINTAKELGIADDYTLAIEARIYELDGQRDKAIAIRDKLINGKVKNVAIYADQALSYLALKQHDKALEVLAIAKGRGLENEVTRNIENKIRRAMEGDG